MDVNECEHNYLMTEVVGISDIDYNDDVIYVTVREICEECGKTIRQTTKKFKSVDDL